MSEPNPLHNLLRWRIGNDRHVRLGHPRLEHGLHDTRRFRLRQPERTVLDQLVHNVDALQLQLLDRFLRDLTPLDGFSIRHVVRTVDVHGIVGTARFLHPHLALLLPVDLHLLRLRLLRLLNVERRSQELVGQHDEGFADDPAGRRRQDLEEQLRQAPIDQILGG